MKIKRFVILALFICAGTYLFIFSKKMVKDSGSSSLNSGVSQYMTVSEKVQPEVVKYDIKPLEEVDLLSYIAQDQIYTYYSNLNDVEKDYKTIFLKPDVSEYDVGGTHIAVIRTEDRSTIDYIVGKSRKQVSESFQYLTYIDQFPTLTSIDEPIYPDDENADSSKLEDYYAASRDYWDSLEYYNIEMTVYEKIDISEETLLINNDDGKIIYNENRTNAKGIPMIVRGYDRAYDVERQEYMEVLKNQYVTEQYGYYEAYFADEHTVYNVSGKNDLQGFLDFLDKFGETQQ